MSDEEAPTLDVIDIAALGVIVVCFLTALIVGLS